MVISPLVRRGTIDHTLYDHSSMPATVERLYGMKNLTARDAVANDFLHLLNLSSPRTDAPTTLPEPAMHPTSLGCEADDDSPQTQDELLVKRSELRIARRTGHYRDRPLAEFPPSPSQIGFTGVALLRILSTAEPPERKLWIQQYKEIESGVDAALFMTEAKLKIRFGIDLKRQERVDRTRTARDRTGSAPTASDA